jgi:SET domain-containing protein
MFMSAVCKLPRLMDIDRSGERFALFADKSKIDGLGCFTSDFIPFGQFIAEFTGELISPAESARRRLGRRRYTLCALDQNWDIDGSVGGNCTRYINHSCVPNCEAKMQFGRIMIYALRNIEPNEELTVDYQYSYHSNRKVCRCREQACRGVINLSQ